MATRDKGWQGVAYLLYEKEHGVPGLQWLWGQGQYSDQGQWLLRLRAKPPDSRTVS